MVVMQQYGGPSFCPACGESDRESDIEVMRDPSNVASYWLDCSNCGWCGSLSPALFIPTDDVVLSEPEEND